MSSKNFWAKTSVALFLSFDNWKNIAREAACNWMYKSPGYPITGTQLQNRTREIGHPRPRDRATISNSNWTEWSTIQGLIARVISKSDEREARGRFEITSTITPWIVQHEVQLPINRSYNKFRN